MQICKQSQMYYKFSAKILEMQKNFLRLYGSLPGLYVSTPDLHLGHNVYSGQVQYITGIYCIAS